MKRERAIQVHGGCITAVVCLLSCSLPVSSTIAALIVHVADAVCVYHCVSLTAATDLQRYAITSRHPAAQRFPQKLLARA